MNIEYMVIKVLKVARRYIYHSYFFILYEIFIYIQKDRDVFSDGGLMDIIKEKSIYYSFYYCYTRKELISNNT